MSFQPYKNDNWSIVTGQDFREVIVVRDPTQPKIPNPDYSRCDPNSQKEIYPEKDLTGYQVETDFRAAKDSSSSLVKSLSVGSGITITGGAIELVS